MRDGKVCVNCHLPACDPRCPDAEQTPLFECAACGEPIYAGEDLPEEEKQAQQAEAPKREPIFCEKCGNPILDDVKRGGEVWKAEDIAAYTKKMFKISMCKKCGEKTAKGDG